MPEGKNIFIANYYGFGIFFGNMKQTRLYLLPVHRTYVVYGCVTPFVFVGIFKYIHF